MKLFYTSGLDGIDGAGWVCHKWLCVEDCR